MRVYPKEERIDMIFVIGECLQNCLLASRVYAERYPNRNHPNKAVFERLFAQFKRTGSVVNEKPRREKPVTSNDEVELAVILSVIENPHIGQNQVSENMNISQASVSRILNNHN